MTNCKHCDKEYDVVETQRVFGDVPWTYTYGMCSAKCYTDHQTKYQVEDKSFKCECGNTHFRAHQVCHHDIVVDEDNHFVVDKGVYDSKTPFGPYTCTECDREYEEILDK